jgi:hypothetical protein
VNFCFQTIEGLWFLDLGYSYDNESIYSGRGKFMPMPLKSKILETPGSLVTDDIKKVSIMNLDVEFAGLSHGTGTI